MHFNFKDMIENQTVAEYNKNYKRIKDLVQKCTVNGQLDIDKAVKKATSDSKRIEAEWKAINRGKIAIELGYEEVGECFLQRAHEISDKNNTVDGKKVFREYKLEALMRIFDSEGNDIA